MIAFSFWRVLDEIVRQFVPQVTDITKALAALIVGLLIVHLTPEEPTR